MAPIAKEFVWVMFLPHVSHGVGPLRCVKIHVCPVAPPTPRETLLFVHFVNRAAPLRATEWFVRSQLRREGELKQENELSSLFFIWNSLQLTSRSESVNLSVFNCHVAGFELCDHVWSNDTVALICSMEPTRKEIIHFSLFFQHPPTPSFRSLPAFCTVAVHFAALHIVDQPLLCSCLQSISCRHPACCLAQRGAEGMFPYIMMQRQGGCGGQKNCCGCTSARARCASAEKG